VSDFLGAQIAAALILAIFSVAFMLRMERKSIIALILAMHNTKHLEWNISNIQISFAHFISEAKLLSEVEDDNIRKRYRKNIIRARGKFISSILASFPNRIFYNKIIGSSESIIKHAMDCNCDKLNAECANLHFYLSEILREERNKTLIAVGV